MQRQKRIHKIGSISGCNQVRFAIQLLRFPALQMFRDGILGKGAQDNDGTSQKEDSREAFLCTCVISFCYLKFITDAPYRCDRPGTVVLDLLAQTLHMDIHGSCVADVFVSPDMIEKLLTRKYLIR